MKRLACIHLMLIALRGLAFASDKDVSAILQVHALERRGHLTGSAEFIAKAVGDQLTVVENGAVQVSSREDVPRTFANYLTSVHYSAWEDVIPPAVHISTDPKTAWAIIQIQATYVESAKPSVQHQFVSSWIAIYQKGNGRWRMTAIASGCNPPCGLPAEEK